ncbi:MAG: DUF530 family protein, partial [Candidatus Micrarchaeota archaeon]|nr:DUF530 family protein [Candidatus Micrarchaeota archaeon]
ADVFPLGREALAGRLPLGGQYVGMLAQRRDNAIITYKKVMELLEGEREAGKKVDYAIRYMGKDGWTTASLKCSPRKDMAGRVRSIYGKEARIVATRIYEAEGLLVGKRSARICLSIAYACLASDVTEEELAGKFGSGYGKLAEYEGMLKKAGLAQGVRADVLEGYEELKQELAKKGFVKFEGDIAVIDAGILKLLVKKRNTYRGACERSALGLLALDVFRHFILRPKRERKASPYFPDLGEKSAGRLAKILAPLSSKPFELKNPAVVIAKKL